MELRIRGWESQGLRCPDVPVELIDAGNKSGIVSIIQMPNGTGKTTTLELLRACLSGDGSNWIPARVCEYQSQDRPQDGTFRLNLTVDGRPLVFEMAFDFQVGRVAYTTISPMVGGRHDGWAPPPDVRRFLHKDFVDLIVFDGEFASDLLKPDKTNAERAVDAMSQLYLLDTAKDIAEADRDRAIKSAGVSANRTTLEKVQRQVTDLVARVALVRKKRKETAATLDKLYVKQEKLSATYNSSLRFSESATNQLAAAKDRLHQLELCVRESAERLMEVLRVPAFVDARFRVEIERFREGLQSARLPSSTSQQFFLELAEQEFCICGRPLDPAQRTDLLTQAEKFLGTEEAGVLNALKKEVDSTIEMISDDPTMGAARCSEALVEVQGKHFKALTDLRELERELEDQSKVDLTDLRRELDSVEEEIEKYKTVVEEIDREKTPSDGDDSWCLKALEARKRDAQRKLEALTGTVEIGERTALVLQFIDRAKHKARASARGALVEEGNLRLRKILRQSPLEIEAIDKHIHLRGQTGASVGQKLAVAYVVLGGLLYRGAHSLPFVVDSPANPIDNTVRREIGQMLPQLCDQFITFVISSEKASFTNVLGEHAKTAQYVTIFRDLPSAARYKELIPTGKTRSSDRFILVEDREFFDHFDVDDESGV